MSTDRAKRYAANRTVSDEKSCGCLFCGSHRYLTVDHLDGNENNGESANLAWLCKSCNTRKGAAFAKAGIGRRTARYNPDLGLSPQERKNYQQLGFDFPPRGEYDAARAADRKRRQQDHAADLRRRREEKQAETRRKRADRIAEQKSLREGISRLGLELQRARKAGDKEAARELVAEINDLTSDLRRNPASIRSPRQWQEAVNACVGAPSYMSTRAGAERIRATSPAARRKFAAASRWNPAKAKVPTYAQYAWAVATHCAGDKRAFHGGVHGCGAHDEGGAIIHATPPNVRRQYARIMDARRRQRERSARDEVPF
jgi:5-methylcytosine-specific restriction endonuclease McrA